MASSAKKSNRQFERAYFVQFENHHTEQECIKAYRKAFRRAPESITAPGASKTPWWWLGYVTLDEQTAFNEARQLRFDFFSQRAIRTKKKPGQTKEDVLFDGCC